MTPARVARVASRHAGGPSRIAGFSLIEIVIAVAIVGILTSIAYPLYTDHVVESRRASARLALMNVLRVQERNYINQHAYATLSVLGYPEDTVGVHKDGSVVAAGNGLYDLSIDLPDDADDFVARAVATGLQTADDDCPVLTLSADGERGPDISCW